MKQHLDDYTDRKEQLTACTGHTTSLDPQIWRFKEQVHSERCVQQTQICSTGIFTAEAYDAVMMIGEAAMIEDGVNMTENIRNIGIDYGGESGTHTFLANGDVGGSGYDVCTFNHVPADGGLDYYNCDMMWTAAGRLEACTIHGHYCKDWIP